MRKRLSGAGHFPARYEGGWDEANLTSPEVAPHISASQEIGPTLT